MKCECGGTVHLEKGPGDYVASWCDRCTPVVRVRIPLGNPYLDRLAAGGKNPHGKKSEKRIAKAMGAKLHRGSGAARGKKSDASLPAYRLEMKSTTTATLPLEMAWLVKITQEALAAGQTPVVVCSFVDAHGRPRLKQFAEWVLIPRVTFQELTEGS